jgi:cytokinin dehydrogenase
MEFERSSREIADVDQDFGRVFLGTSRGVLRPRSAEDVAEAVKHAVDSQTTLTIRGLGHSAGGQALPNGSTVLDLTHMRNVGPVDVDRLTVRCESGARLRDVVAATLPHRLLPLALTNLLDLTIGGIVSVGGGVGPGSHRSGPIAASVTELQVVTGEGTMHRCSPAEEPDLFNAVRGGLGRSGVIVAADLKLRPVLPRIRTYYLLYEDHGSWLNDQRTLARSGSVDSIEGYCSASAQGLRGTGGDRRAFAQWFFPLQVSIEFDDKAPELPSGLKPYRLVAAEDDQIEHFPTRHDPRFAMMRRLGWWESVHPYVTAFIEAGALEGVLPAVLDALPLILGDGHRTFFVEREGAPMFTALPEGDDDVVFFSIMHTQIPPVLLEDSLGALRQVSELLIEAGGKRYPPDWLGDPGELDWRRQLGPRYEQWIAAKERFDPHGVFQSVLFA